ncbi:MAG: phospholipid/cholesterol/gamma-HCH transport system ATP-binding protein [Pseudomonadota bacterium]|nr:phospholipid/cholesterol/gamma-HCH transport system ATP-binding protein [Pseudomonadota bacterium]
MSQHQAPAAGVEPAAVPDDIAALHDVDYSIDGKVIFRGIRIGIRRGDVTAIMGPSGTGKTTLLRLITGQLRPDAGRVVVDGMDVARLGRRDLYALRRRMGMLFQNGALLTDLDVFENVAFPLREHARLPERIVRNLVLTKLHAVGLRGAAHLQPQQLSGGMGRRVALARAIVMDPQLLLYDEPFAGLDPISMGVVMRLIRSLNDALGISSIVVTHDVREISQIADMSYILSDGQVVASGTPRELHDHPSPIVHQFMEGLADGPVSFHYPAPDLREQLLDRKGAR